MKEKLTLSIDSKIKKQGKAHFGRIPHLSLSQFVEDEIKKEVNKKKGHSFSPKWTGIVKSKADVEKTRLAHIKSKHLK